MAAVESLSGCSGRWRRQGVAERRGAILRSICELGGHDERVMVGVEYSVPDG